MSCPECEKWKAKVDLYKALIDQRFIDNIKRYEHLIDFYQREIELTKKAKDFVEAQYAK